MVQQTYYKGKWRDVVEIDSVHDIDVHVHRYGRSTFDRVGEPECLMPVTCLADVAKGYDTACDGVLKDWAENRRRWHDG